MIRGARHSQAWALPRSTGCQPVCLPGSRGGLLRSTGCQPVCLPGSRGGLLRSTGCQPVCRSGLQWARDCPCHLAGRSLRASCPPLTRRKPRFALQASLGFLRRSIGTGSPSQPLVAQVFNLCVFPFRSALLCVPPIQMLPLSESQEAMTPRGAARAREPALLTSGAWIAERSQHRASGGPGTDPPPADWSARSERPARWHGQSRAHCKPERHTG